MYPSHLEGYITEDIESKLELNPSSILDMLYEAIDYKDELTTEGGVIPFKMGKDT